MTEQQEDLTYLEIQAANLAEKEKFFQENVASSDGINVSNSQRAAAKAKEATNAKKNNKTKAKTTEAVATRKSRRLEEKPAPSYKESEDSSRDGDGEASSHVSRRDGRAEAVAGARARSRPQLRPRRPVSYLEEDLEDIDSVIFCGSCGEAKVDGCQLHPPVFSKFSDFKLVVTRSHIQGAGEGVINHGPEIPEGVLFGPYTGKFYPADVHKKMPDSGNAWRIFNPSNGRTAGFIDPGVVEDANKHWMAKVNCTAKTARQNLVGFQYRGQIFYRVIKDIPKGVELLVYYGDSYAKQLGIKTDELDRFPGKEDHRWEGSTCPHCSTTFSTVQFLDEHLGRDGGQLTCKVKRKMDRGGAMAVPAASSSKTGVKKDWRKPVICPEEGCGKTFASTSSLGLHLRVLHEKGQSFKCLDCGKLFGAKAHLDIHVRTVHEERQPFKCPDCGLLFGQKSNLNRHVKSVHKNVRLHVCETCRKAFGRRSDLKKHQEQVHEGQKRVRRGRIHPCPVCSHLFYYPSQVKRHVEKIHPKVAEEEKKAYEEAHPFPCARCGKRFATKEEKERHEKKLH